MLELHISVRTLCILFWEHLGGEISNEEKIPPHPTPPPQAILLESVETMLSLSTKCCQAEKKEESQTGSSSPQFPAQVLSSSSSKTMLALLEDRLPKKLFLFESNLWKGVSIPKFYFSRTSFFQKLLTLSNLLTFTDWPAGYFRRNLIQFVTSSSASFINAFNRMIYNTTVARPKISFQKFVHRFSSGIR